MTKLTKGKILKTWCTQRHYMTKCVFYQPIRSYSCAQCRSDKVCGCNKRFIWPEHRIKSSCRMSLCSCQSQCLCRQLHDANANRHMLCRVISSKIYHVKRNKPDKFPKNMTGFSYIKFYISHQSFRPHYSLYVSCLVAY